MNNQEKISVTIKEVNSNEIESVYPVFSQLNPKMNLQEFKSNYEQIKSQEYKLFKAVVNRNSAPVGLIGYIFNCDLCVGRAMYIDILVVDKNFRKKGIAKQLMNFALSELQRDKNAHCMRWSTRNDLKDAISFYENQVKEPIGFYYRIDNPCFGK